MGANLILRQVRQIRGGYEILRVDDLDVCDGEHVSVLGPNGAGKTTMLRLLAGVDRPASGTVTLDGVDTTRGGGRKAPGPMSNSGSTRNHGASMTVRRP